jgi:hypothetical protein
METKIEMSQIRGLDKGKRNPSGTLLPRIADWWAENEERAVTSHPRHGIAGAGERKGESCVVGREDGKEKNESSRRGIGGLVSRRKPDLPSAPKARLATTTRRIRLSGVLATERLSCAGGLSEMRKSEENGAVRWFSEGRVASQVYRS